MERKYSRAFYNALDTMLLTEQGVTIIDPSRIDIRGRLTCGKDVTIDVGCIFEGDVQIADNVYIGPYSVIRNAEIGAGTQIDRYCLQNQISPKEKYRIRLAIEELVLQILLPRLPKPHIRILVECAAGEAGPSLTVSYGGERFDPRDTENTLSLTVLRSAAEELRYGFESGAQEPNRVEIRIKRA